MDSRPKVSIILPTYNGGQYIKAAIDSCLNQTFSDLELIVVDDCSTDSTPDIIRSYKDNRLVHIRNKKNLRLPRSLNRGFSAARGDYLTWTSDDNQYLPDALDVMIGCLKNDKSADFIYADYLEHYIESGEKRARELPDKPSFERVCPIGACFLYTKKVYKTIGKYNPDYELVEDYDYWIRVSKKFKFHHCSRILYVYTFHSNSLTSTKKDLQVLFDRVLKFNYGYLTAVEFREGLIDFVDFQWVSSDKKAAFVLIARVLKRILRVSFAAGLTFISVVIPFLSSRAKQYILNRILHAGKR